HPGSGHPSSMYAVPKKRSTGKIVAIVFAVLFLLLAGGCGLFVWAFSEELGDAMVSFDNGVPTDDPASCRVTGTDFAEDYVIEATVVAESAQVQSHYQLELVVTDPEGQTIGLADGILRSVDPGEERTEEVYNTVDSAEPIESVTCEVRRVLRIDA
ncbi:MAG: hypothetical protein ACRBK7_20355, partial [Acidimicrobiales bacterium]